MSGSSQWLTPIRVGRWILNTIFHQALAVIAIYTIWIAAEAYSRPFSWHVILCTVGLIPLGAEALILFASDNVWTQDVERDHKLIMHGVLMGSSAILIITGIAIEIDRGNGVIGYSHFSTDHAITGLICMIFLILALVFGFGAKFSKSLKGFLRPVITKFIHNILGNLTFIFGIVSLCCGYYTDWFKFYTSDSSRTAATVVTAIICTWSLIPAFIAAVKQMQAIMNVSVYRGIPLEVQGVNKPHSIIKLSHNVVDKD